MNEIRASDSIITSNPIYSHCFLNLKFDEISKKSLSRSWTCSYIFSSWRLLKSDIMLMSLKDYLEWMFLCGLKPHLLVLYVEIQFFQYPVLKRRLFVMSS